MSYRAIGLLQSRAPSIAPLPSNKNYPTLILVPYTRELAVFPRVFLFFFLYLILLVHSTNIPR
jgi:hypothetical protein